MDARDIKENPPVVEDGKYLDQIYVLQKQLIDHYVGIEGLPQYPLDVNTKKNQTIIKDFVGRVIEELAEGYESFMLVEQLTHKNRYWISEYNQSEYQQTLNHLQNANEEQADALHFMVELLIFANIQPEDIVDYCRIIIEKHIPITVQHFFDEVDFGNALSVAGTVGSILLYLDNDLSYSVDQMNKVNLFNNLDSDTDTRLMVAGSKYSKEDYYNMKVYMWDVTYHLNIARNYLKNKPWKQSQMMTNELAFQKELTLAFIKLIGYFFNIGLTTEDIYYLYFKKQRVNYFRIHSNY